MNDINTRHRTRGGRLRMPRSRGAASGFLLIVLGIWGAIIPFIGTNFDFAYSAGDGWTAARGWLEVLPGAVAALGGVLLLFSGNRATAMLGGWLAVFGGAWFVVGRAFAGPLALGDVGTPVAATETKQVWLELTYFYGLGALIVFLGAFALGRLSVLSVRDVEFARRPVVAAGPAPAPVTEPVPAREPAQVSESTTEVMQPTTEPEPRHRGWRDMFRGGGGHRLVHH
jgi:hypothetical protein